MLICSRLYKYYCCIVISILIGPTVLDTVEACGCADFKCYRADYFVSYTIPPDEKNSTEKVHTSAALHVNTWDNVTFHQAFIIIVTVYLICAVLQLSLPCYRTLIKMLKSCCHCRKYTAVYHHVPYMYMVMYRCDVHVYHVPLFSNWGLV